MAELAERTSLEALEDRFAEARAAEREALWRQGDVLADAVRAFGGRRGATRRVLRQFAALGFGREGTLRGLLAVAQAFPADVRYPDLPWLLYREVLAWARRRAKAGLGDVNPVDLLARAVEEEWSPADVRRQDAVRPGQTRAHLEATCGSCGSRVRLDTAAAMAGLPVPCPVCHESARRDGQECGVEPQMLGALE